MPEELKKILKEGWPEELKEALKEEFPEELKKILKEEGLTLEELLEARKAHVKRLKRLDRQLSADRCELIIEFE